MNHNNVHFPPDCEITSEQTVLKTNGVEVTKVYVKGFHSVAELGHLGPVDHQHVFGEEDKPLETVVTVTETNQLPSEGYL